MTDDVRIAARRLARRPWLVVAVATTIALGVGATTAIYSVLRAVILRPFPYPDPDRLVAIHESNALLGLDQFSVAPANYLDWRAQAESFRDMVAQRNSAYILSGAGEPEQLAGLEVSANWFDALGVPMALGRGFTVGDSAQTDARVVVLSHRLWRRRFGGDWSVVGRSITLNDAPYHVIGVAAPGVHSPADVWAPLALPPNLAATRGPHFFTVVGRLGDGVTVEQARAELSRIAQRLEEAYPETNRGWSVRVTPLVEQLAGGAGPALVVLMIAAVCVLLIAAANVANILLARGMSRMPEIALRLSLGATRAAIVRDVLMETMLLSTAGGVLGVGLAVTAMNMLRGSYVTLVPRANEVALDPAALMVAGAATVLALLVGGLPPALFVTRRTAAAGLRAATPARGVIRSRSQRGLIVAQAAIAIVLMTGSVLLLKALIRLRGADLGFNPENVATATINLPRAGYPGPAAQKAFAAELVRRIRSQPGMDAAAIADAVPGGAGQGFLYFGIPGRSFDAGQQPGSQLRAATADYFAVLEIALISGRVFQASDREEAAPVVIIDEPLARRYFPGDNALGKFVLVGGDTVPKEIVGIVRGVRHNGPDGVDQPVMYIPLAQARLRTGQMSILVRAADVAAAGRVVREQLRALGSGVPIYNEQTLAERVAQSMGPVRIVTSLSVIFGICAAFLACIGVYGVLSFAVAQRTREMGVRLALGAPPGRVVLGVAGNGMAVVGVGVLVGLGLSWWATRALAAVLTSVRPGDVTSFVFASALFLIIAAVASIIPAARAGRVDPLTALRAD